MTEKENRTTQGIPNCSVTTYLTTSTLTPSSVLLHGLVETDFIPSTRSLFRRVSSTVNRTRVFFSSTKGPSRTPSSRRVRLMWHSRRLSPLPLYHSLLRPFYSSLVYRFPDSKVGLFMSETKLPLPFDTYENHHLNHVHHKSFSNWSRPEEGDGIGTDELFTLPLMTVSRWRYFPTLEVPFLGSRFLALRRCGRKSRVPLE